MSVSPGDTSRCNRRYSSLPELVALRVADRAVAVAETDEGVALWRLEPGELPEDLQRRLWKAPGRFWVTDPHAMAHPVWLRIEGPNDADTRRVSNRLGLPLAVEFRRREVGNPFAGLRPEREFG